MNMLRKMFEGNHETKTPDKLVNTKIYLAVSVIGCLFCLISFILALVSQQTVSCVIFLIALLVCMNCGIEWFKHKGLNH
jgi:predicted membrane channel-forming protein YqfA (hemolysin III family)